MGMNYEFKDDGGVVVSGTFVDLALANLLTWLLQEKRIGVLEINEPSGATHRLHFDRGRPVGVDLGAYVGDVGRILLEKGAINDEQYNNFLMKLAEGDLPAEAVLLQMELADEDLVGEVTATHHRRKLNHLFSVQEASFRFETRARPERSDVRPFDVNIYSIVFNGIKNTFNEGRLAASLRSVDDRAIRIQPAVLQLERLLPLDEDETHALPRLKRWTTVARFSARSGLGETSSRMLLAILHVCDFLESADPADIDLPLDLDASVGRDAVEVTPAAPAEESVAPMNLSPEAFSQSVSVEVGGVKATPASRETVDPEPPAPAATPEPQATRETDATEPTSAASAEAEEEAVQDEPPPAEPEAPAEGDGRSAAGPSAETPPLDAAPKLTAAEQARMAVMGTSAAAINGGSAAVPSASRSTAPPRRQARAGATASPKGAAPQAKETSSVGPAPGDREPTPAKEPVERPESKTPVRKPAPQSPRTEPVRKATPRSSRPEPEPTKAPETPSSGRDFRRDSSPAPTRNLDLETPEQKEQRDRITAKAEQIDSGSYYDLLEIKPNATVHEVRQQYYRLSRVYHPDRVAGTPLADLKSTLDDIFAKLNESYSCLCAPAKRREYDSIGSADEVQDLKDKTAKAGQAELQYTKGEVFLRRRDFAQAEEHFKWAVELLPEEGEYLAAYGWAILNNSNHKPEEGRKKAKAVLTRAEALHGTLDRLHYYLGMLYKAEDAMEKAASHFRTAVRLNENHIDAARELRYALLAIEKQGKGKKGGLFGLFKK